jgi:hypothetical protein
MLLAEGFLCAAAEETAGTKTRAGRRRTRAAGRTIRIGEAPSDFPVGKGFILTQRMESLKESAGREASRFGKKGEARRARI